MDVEKLYVQNYKCFKEFEIDNIKPINIIIGKNNIGKSSILDIIEIIYGTRTIPQMTEILIKKNMDEEIIRYVFAEDTHSHDIPAANNYEFGKKFINQKITYKLDNTTRNTLPKNFSYYNPTLPKEQIDYWDEVVRRIRLKTKIPKRILAERNIFPEDNENNMDVDSNGNGITRIITNYLNRDKYEESLVKDKLLNKLNEIMGEDARFTEIITQQIDTSNGTKWEIFLREEGKGRISLSNSGSGLKTILMVLAYTILIPNVEKIDISNYIFLFEELENNLHPSLQRRLLKYIEELTQQNAIFFLTTHSNVTLDSNQNSNLISIYHVQKDYDNEVKVNNISNKIQKNSILDDLGVKASDILQSNGIIWVEGPSDRIYINKWIEMSTRGELKEGKDYQCVFYGGRLLSNLTLEEENDLINLMNVNRNAIILIDSDKKHNNSPINETKKRIKEEAEKNGVYVWITKGREIENYIPSNLIKKFYGKEKSNEELGQFQNIEEYIDILKPEEGKKFLRDKTGFAVEILKEATKEDFKDVYDFSKRISDVENIIYSWNCNN